ncbi:MAG: fibronectin type III domain-containing protein, partial [Bryobacteraceae bacterium]
DYYNGQDGENFDPLLIENNYWEQGDPDSSRKNVTETGNRLISALSQVPRSVIENAGIEPKYRRILAETYAKSSAPESPSRVGAVSGKNSAYIVWNPPVFDGGSPMQSYTVTANNGAQTTISVAEFMKKAYVEMPGLTSGREYTFTVEARNANGASPPSLPSLPIRIRTEPRIPAAAPASVKAYPGHKMASIHFRAPARNRNEEQDAPILGYIVTVNPAGRKVVFEGRPALVLGGRHTTFYVIAGLRSGHTYTFSIAAMTPAGTGAAATSAPVTIQ